MNHVVGAAAGRMQGVQVGDTAFAEVDLATHAREIFFVSGGKIVEYHHLVASAHEFVDKIRSDETGAAGNEVTHALKSFWGEQKTNGKIPKTAAGILLVCAPPFEYAEP